MAEKLILADKVFTIGIIYLTTQKASEMGLELLFDYSYIPSIAYPVAAAFDRNSKVVSAIPLDVNPEKLKIDEHYKSTVLSAARAKLMPQQQTTLTGSNLFYL